VDNVHNVRKSHDFSREEQKRVSDIGRFSARDLRRLEVCGAKWENLPGRIRNTGFGLGQAAWVYIGFGENKGRP
jgi:hypothetical protein